MTAIKRWNVEILIGEVDDRTYAEAQLYDEIRDDLVGAGQAWLRPDEPHRTE
ncbi:dsRBD fold-containing protein, partial [Plantactinospora sp. B6F1]|uniref:dsRBD fold-containing protein n=1 Tax=Plantactinospora sp. B6F1 TaxID=3158971 RepID=UPI0032D8FD39